MALTFFFISSQILSLMNQSFYTVQSNDSLDLVYSDNSLSLNDEQSNQFQICLLIILDPPLPRKKWSFKEDRSNKPKNDSLYSKHVCFGENLSTTAGYTNRDDFWNSQKNRKLPKTTRFQDLRVVAFFLRGFAGFLPSRLMRCKHFLAFVSPSPKSCNQSPKIEDQSSIQVFWVKSVDIGQIPKTPIVFQDLEGRGQ